METVKLNEFDIMGIFTLSDISGIEDYVTKLSDNEYLSRSANYYGSKSCTELSRTREQLKPLISNNNSKKNFVVLENMLNCSAKVFFLELQKKILKKDNDINFEIAKACLDEDSKNIVNLLNGNCNYISNYTLPEGDEMSLDRLIEMDNKALLYVFANSLEFDKKYDVLIPGYGATLIGPFFKAIHGFDYTNLLKSKYAKDKNQNDVQHDNIIDLVSNPSIISTENNILLLDDNVGTGETMKEIKHKLKEQNVSCICGGIQYNWINYHRFSLGEKDTRFDISEFDIITPFNYPGHKLLDHSIDHLKKSGKSYIKYLQAKDYRQENISDMLSLIERSERYTKKEGIDLYNLPHVMPSAEKSIKSIKDNVYIISTQGNILTSKKESSFLSKLQNEVLPLEDQTLYSNDTANSQMPSIAKDID